MPKMFYLVVKDKQRKIDEGFYLGRRSDDVYYASACDPKEIKNLAKIFHLTKYRITED